jgi:aminomethyltransferase
MSKDQASDNLKTVFYDRHVSLGAQMEAFGGWEMPMFYSDGIIKEHLATRKTAGMFDVSHMGRFVIRGSGALKFLQYVLSNNAEALNMIDIGAQYTLIPSETGGVIDDAYLYGFVEDEYLLVVNAANRLKDWDHFQKIAENFDAVELVDRTDDIAMLSLQGPTSRELLEGVIQSGRIPRPLRNAVSTVTIAGAEVQVARTGYTGEPQGFELFAPRSSGTDVWDRLVNLGAVPVGLGARDTLRLEAGLPLYGHELGIDPDGKEIPALACPTAKTAVSFSPVKGEFIGCPRLADQLQAYSKIIFRDYSQIADLPRLIWTVAVAGRGVARRGAKIRKGEKHVGYVTSGTMVPMWKVDGEGLDSRQTDQHQLRSICLAYVDSDVVEGDRVTIEIRKKRVDAVMVPYHLRSEAPPYARPIVFDHQPTEDRLAGIAAPAAVNRLIENTIENTLWRQTECINLIPSEMTASIPVRLLSVMDPAFRYAEHRKSKAFYDAEIFYYQGIEFIREVERLLRSELRVFLGCPEVETRLVSGQMANTAVFSAMVDYLNRADRKREPRRIQRVMNHHIGAGGHLSAQPMGALRDYVARDPGTDRPALVNFPVLADNPYQIDVPLALEFIDEYRPELIIFGKSMIIHKEPVSEIRRFVDSSKLNPVILYDMAHVLGLIGAYFQQPFKEGADLVTGSTHKTFFGTQRGIAGSRFLETEERYELWEALERRTFPGSVSNHHLGTMLGLLMAAYEMNRFKEVYQERVISNAKAFARALFDCGLPVCGDPNMDFTETHQVMLEVGYGRGHETASRLESNNIICNYQATPDEEGFTVAGALRTGVAEMTRFGMEVQDFQKLAQLIKEVIVDRKDVKEEVAAFRKQFLEMRYCFSEADLDDFIQKLHGLI